MLTSGLFALVYAPQALAAPSTWDFVPASSKLYVQVFRDETTLMSTAAHDHVIAAVDWKGSVTLDPEDLSAGSVSVQIPVSGLRPDLPDMRSLVGYDVMLTEAQQAQVTEHMLSGDQLDGKSFASISFTGSRCSGALEALTVTATLMIRGKSRHLEVPVQVSFEDEAIRVQGSFQVGHADVGLKPYSALFGQLKNREDLHFTFDVVGAPR